MNKYDNVSWSKKELERERRRALKHEKRVRRELEKAKVRERDLEIEEIRSSNTVTIEKKKVSTTKLLMLFIFGNCTIVEAYSMWVMYVLGDLSALYALIGAVITESISFAIYCVKAFNETKEEERIRLEREKFEYEAGIYADEVVEEAADIIEE
jgi:hypothetical protein